MATQTQARSTKTGLPTTAAATAAREWGGRQRRRSETPSHEGLRGGTMGGRYWYEDDRPRTTTLNPASDQGTQVGPPTHSLTETHLSIHTRLFALPSAYNHLAPHLRGLRNPSPAPEGTKEVSGGPTEEWVMSCSAAVEDKVSYIEEDPAREVPVRPVGRDGEADWDRLKERMDSDGFASVYQAGTLGFEKNDTICQTVEEILEIARWHTLTSDTREIALGTYEDLSYRLVQAVEMFEEGRKLREKLEEVCLRDLGGWVREAGRVHREEVGKGKEAGWVSSRIQRKQRWEEKQKGRRVGVEVIHHRGEARLSELLDRGVREIKKDVVEALEESVPKLQDIVCDNVYKLHRETLGRCFEVFLKHGYRFERVKPEMNARNGFIEYGKAVLRCVRTMLEIEKLEGARIFKGKKEMGRLYQDLRDDIKDACEALRIYTTLC